MKNADKPIYPVMMQQVGENSFRASKPIDPKEWNFPTEGLTKREYFAGLATQGLLANPQYWKRVYKTLSSLKADKASIECVFAQFSIKLADEILQQLEEK